MRLGIVSNCAQDFFFFSLKKWLGREKERWRAKKNKNRKNGSYLKNCISYTEIVFQRDDKRSVIASLCAHSNSRHSIWFVVGIAWQMICQCSKFLNFSLSLSFFFVAHTIDGALTVPITYDNANANLSVYYAIFNQKTDGIWHSLSSFNDYYLFLSSNVVSEFYCPWNAIYHLS